MDSILQFLEVISNNNFMNTFSFLFGLTSVILGIISIIIAFKFYHYAKNSETHTEKLLSDIGNKATILEDISKNLIDKLIKYSTTEKDNLFKYVMDFASNQNTKNIEIKNNENINDVESELHDLYIKYYYYIYKTNWLASRLSIHMNSKESIIGIVKDLNESYDQFKMIRKTLSSIDKTKLKSSPNYDLYAIIDNSSDEIKSGKWLLDFSFIQDKLNQ